MMLKLVVAVVLSLYPLTLLAKTDANRGLESYIMDLLELTVLHDDELVHFADSLDQGEIINPMCQGTTCSTARLIHKETLQKYLDENLNLAELREWVLQLLKKRGHNWTKREEVQEKTKVLSKFTSTRMDSGHGSTCVMSSEKTLNCCGKRDELAATRCKEAASPESILELASGSLHVCLLDTRNSVKCFGDNTYEQLDVPVDLGEVKQIAAGWHRTCAIRVDGELRCWGNSWYQRLNVPKDLGPAAQVSVGDSHICALLESGSVQCWGFSFYNLDDVPVDLGPAIRISAGGRHTCAILEGARVRCWGSNVSGQSHPPTALGPVIQVSAGEFHTCVLLEDARVQCWGSRSSGQCDVPEDLGPVLQIAAGHYHTCALEESGAVRCWGDFTNFPADIRGFTSGLLSSSISPSH